MSVSPELGTRPRPDTTGPVRYDKPPVGDPVRPELNGINPIFDTANPFWVPWGALEIQFDFAETKYGATAYTVEGSKTADFAEFNEVGSPALGRSVAVQVMNQPLQPGTQYYFRVKATMADGESAYSETLSAPTASLPNASQVPAEAPALTIDIAVTFNSVTATPTATANPVTASPIMWTGCWVEAEFGGRSDLQNDTPYTWGGGDFPALREGARVRARGFTCDEEGNVTYAVSDWAIIPPEV